VDGVDRAGFVVVAVLVALMGGAIVEQATDAEPTVADSEAEAGADPAGDLVEAFRRSRTATYRATGTFERTAPDGERIAAKVEVVQRRPDRLLRQFGEVHGRRGDRELRCPAPTGGEEPECGLGPPGKGFDELVEDEVEAFRVLVSPPDPLYEVRRLSGSCWRMTRTRNDPRSGYGLETELCVDPASGALRSVEIDHGRIQERTAYDAITTEVTSADLEP
jgi:hypothetical protein